MTVISPEVRQQIESAPTTGDELIGRQALLAITHRLLVAADARHRRHLLLALNKDDDYRDASRQELVYTINLGTFDHLITARRPDEASAVLSSGST